MKKLKVNRPLEKATRNRAHLVKVMTQVQGRTGQYQAHRWINPNKAMDILKEDLAKQGLKGAKSLEFEDPKTGKVLDEKQLLDQMEKEGFKGTLQEYAKQYKIKAKGSKKNIAAAKPKTKEKPKAVVETQNTSNQRDFNKLFNKSNKIQDSKTRETANKLIAASEQRIKADFEDKINKLAADKGNRTFIDQYNNARSAINEAKASVGMLDAAISNADNKNLWDALSQIDLNNKNEVESTISMALSVWPDDKEIVESQKRAFDEYKSEIDKIYMNTDEPFDSISEGSDKQIAWAQDIWNDFRANTKETEKGMRDLAYSDDRDIASFSNKFLDAYDEILNDPNSVNWIEDYREKGTYAILEKMYEDIATMPNLDVGVKFEKRKRKVSVALHEISRLLTNGGGSDPQALELIAKAGSLVEKIDNSDDDDDFYKRAFNTAGSYHGMNEPRAGELFEAKNKLKTIIEKLDDSKPENIFMNDTLYKVAQFAYVNEFLNNTKDFENSEIIEEYSSEEKEEIMRFRARIYCIIDTYKNSQETFDKYYGKRVNKDNIGTLEKAINFDNKIMWNIVLKNKLDPYKDADTFANLYEVATGDLKDKEDKPINWGAMKRFGTKKILSNGLTQPLKSLSAVEEQAKAFKNEHTDILARNTLDMFGLDIPLYVKRNGKAIKLGRKEVHGFCQFDENGPREISVVDYTDKKHSYKTTIHESMHALFAKTFNEEGKQLARVLSHENHEGLVELIGQASARKVYGEEANSMTPSYLSFVTKTALQLRFGGMFEGKGIYDVATEIGEMAAKGDSDGLFQVAENLERFKDIPMERLTNDITYDIIENPDRVDEKAAKLNKEKNLGEPSELANLVEELKRGTISLSQALNSPQFGPLAALLILEFLEDEDEDFGLIPF